MIDSHCHLDFPHFDQDREKVMVAAAEKGVAGFLVPGTQAQYFKRVIKLATGSSLVRFALGLHPYFLDTFCDADLSELETEARRCQQQLPKKLVAIGEIGIDNAIAIDAATQRAVFSHQLELASGLGLPVIIHHRRSHNDIVRLLKQYRFSQGGIIHAFTGSVQEARTYIDLGFYLGVGGGITYPRANKTRSTIKGIGLGHLVLETDSPDMPLCGFQGQRNSPSQLPLIAKSLAKLLELPVSEIEAQTDKNLLDAIPNW